MNSRYSSTRFKVAAAVLVVCLAYVDYLTGLQFSLFPLYLIPLALVAWNNGLRASLWFFALAGACIWAKAALEHRNLPGHLWYWDTFIKTLLLVLLPYSLWKIKHLLIELQLAHEELCKTNASLEQAVSERTRELSLTVEDLKREVAQRTKLALDLQVETAERLRVQVELREKDLMLMQQSRLAAMGEMIGNIAHQWRQPLNRLGVLAQDVLLTHDAGGADGTYLEDHVKKTMETIHHMSQTIEDFRNFFRPDKEKTRFDGVDAIETTLSLLEEGLKSQHVITEIDRSGDAFVFGFPNEYKQVLINIVANARDAFAERKTPHPHIRFTAWSEEGTSYVTVADNAGGIPEEIIDRLFEPYFTTKEPDKGTGLGLYMSRMIIERNMGGRLTARNIAGGAEFIIATPSTG